MPVQRDVRVCFDLVEFLTYHMHDVGITEQDARDLARAARMTDTRELKNLHGTAYLDARKNLTVAQRRKLLQLVLEARADPAYGGENVQCDAPTCTSVPALYSGGLCNGTTLSMNTCTSADQATQSTQSATLINGTRFTAASCEGDMSGVCAALQGSFKPEYCRGSVGGAPFCRNLAFATASTNPDLCVSDKDCLTVKVKLCSTSSSDSDSNATQCNTSNVTLTMRSRVDVICCAEVKAVATQACTGIDTSLLDKLVNMMRDSKECGVYPNCTSTVTTDAVLYAGGTKSACSWTLAGVMLLLSVSCPLASG